MFTVMKIQPVAITSCSRAGAKRRADKEPFYQEVMLTEVMLTVRRKLVRHWEGKPREITETLDSRAELELYK